VTGERSEHARRRVVFAGLGRMGVHLARHVAGAAPDGVAVLAYDTAASARERAAAAGANVIAELPAGLGAGDVVCLSVPDGAAVRALLAALVPRQPRPGLLLLDFSSVAPRDARAIAAELATDEIRYVDAPVTGGVLGAEQGTLTTIVGAEAADLAPVRWIPESFSSRVVHAGATGAGALLKTLNNMIFNVASIAAMEGMIVARRAGIADDVLLDVLNHGTAATYFSQVRYPKYVATRTFDAGMRLGLVDKDLQIALDAAGELDCELQLCTTGRGMWARALAELGPDADTTRMMDVVARSSTGSGILELFDTVPR
jgi:3-hydroxyisobutyrate dehydrogenase